MTRTPIFVLFLLICVRAVADERPNIQLPNILLIAVDDMLYNTPVSFGGQIKGLEKLTQLTHLHLQGNQLTDIKGLENLTQLTRLYLYGNQLTDVKGLEKLTQLKSLYLAHNQLTELPITGL